MARVETVDRVAAVTATLHDGTNMIVLSEGKTVRVAKSSVAYLEDRHALRPEDAKEDDTAESGMPAQSDDTFDIPDGHSVTEKGGGWYEITGPEGFEPIKAHGADDLRAKLAEIGTEADAPAT